MAMSPLALIAAALCLCLGLAAAAVPAGAEAPQLWGSPNGSQMMLQCLREAEQGNAEVSVSPSGVVTCCRQGFCIACDGPGTCQVGVVGPGNVLDSSPPQSAPADPSQPATALPQMQSHIQR